MVCVKAMTKASGCDVFTKFIVFLVHFTASLLLMVWYFQNDRCAKLNNRANYYNAQTFDLSTSRLFSPVLVTNNNMAYAYNANFDTDFLKINGSCHHLNLTNISSVHVIHYNTGVSIDTTSPLCMFKGVMPSMDIAYIREDWMLGGINNMVFLMMLFEWITASLPWIIS